MWPDPLTLRVLPSPWRLLFSSSLAFSHLSPPNQRYCNWERIRKQSHPHCAMWRMAMPLHAPFASTWWRTLTSSWPATPPRTKSSSLLNRFTFTYSRWLSWVCEPFAKLDWKSFPCYYPAVQGAWNNPSRLWGSSLLFQLISFNKIYCIYLCLKIACDPLSWI